MINNLKVIIKNIKINNINNIMKILNKKVMKMKIKNKFKII